MSKYVDGKLCLTYFMSAENNSDKIMSKYVDRKYVGHILCRQKIFLRHIRQITTLCGLFIFSKIIYYNKYKKKFPYKGFWEEEKIERNL